MSFITTSSPVFLAAFLTQDLLTLKLNKIEDKTRSLIQGQVVKNHYSSTVTEAFISDQWSRSYKSKISQVDLLRKVENRYHMCNV